MLSHRGSEKDSARGTETVEEMRDTFPELNRLESSMEASLCKRVNKKQDARGPRGSSLASQEIAPLTQ